MGRTFFYSLAVFVQIIIYMVTSQLGYYLRQQVNIPLEIAFKDELFGTKITTLEQCVNESYRCVMHTFDIAIATPTS